MLYLLDRDVQCNFNSPFYEEKECGWKYSQRTMTNLGLGSTKRLIRSRVDNSQEDSMNYFMVKDTTFGKHHLTRHIIYPIYVYYLM